MAQKDRRNDQDADEGPQEIPMAPAAAPQKPATRPVAGRAVRRLRQRRRGQGFGCDLLREFPVVVVYQDQRKLGLFAQVA